MTKSIVLKCFLMNVMTSCFISGLNASPTKSLCIFFVSLANSWKYILFHQPADPVFEPLGSFSKETLIVFAFEPYAKAILEANP